MRYSRRQRVEKRIGQFDFAAMGLLLAVTAIAFAPAANCQFTEMDAVTVTSQSHVVSGLSAANLKWVATDFDVGYPIPVTFISLMLDAQWVGMNARAFHIENVVWHAANAVLLYLLLRRMTGSVWRSAAVAAVFAVHPLRAESVAWVSERKDVLSAFFGLLAVHAFVSYARRRGIGWYLLMLPLLALSLFAKPMMVMLPVLLLGLDYWPLGRIGKTISPRGAVVEKIPPAILCGVAAVVGMMGQQAYEPGRKLMAVHFSRGAVLANGVVSFVRYLGKMIWFRHLAAVYPLVEHWPIEMVAAAVGVLAVVTALAAWQIRARPWLAVGWGWYLVMLLPAAGFYVLGDFSIADRYTYFPMIGVLIMLVWSLPEQRGRIAIAGGFVVVIVGLVAATRAQVETWRDSLTLYEHAIRVAGPSDLACDGMGRALLKAHRPAEAARYFEEALALNPGMGIHGNLGIALDEAGEPERAAEQYRLGLAGGENAEQMLYNLGSDLLKLDRPAEARVELGRAVELSPDSLEDRANWATALLRTGDFDGAIKQCRILLAKSPQATGVRNTLAMALAATGDAGGAKAQLQLAILHDPGSSFSYNQLGALCLGNGEVKYAIECFKEAIRLDPGNEEAKRNLEVADSTRK